MYSRLEAPRRPTTSAWALFGAYLTLDVVLQSERPAYFGNQPLAGKRLRSLIYKGIQVPGRVIDKVGGA